MLQNFSYRKIIKQYPAKKIRIKNVRLINKSLLFFYIVLILWYLSVFKNNISLTTCRGIITIELHIFKVYNSLSFDISIHL